TNRTRDGVGDALRQCRRCRTFSVALLQVLDAELESRVVTSRVGTGGEHAEYDGTAQARREPCDPHRKRNGAPEEAGLRRRDCTTSQIGQHADGAPAPQRAYDVN